jgi:dimethylargininase
MLSAYVRPVSRSIVGGCLLTYVQERACIDYERAVRQHEGYARSLEELGVKVRRLPAAHDLPDAVFVEDTAVVVDEVAVVTQMGARPRRAEVESSAAALARHRTVRRINSNGTLEGGDVVRIGRTFYVGLSTRTNSDGVEQLRRILEPFDYQVRPVAVTGCLHLGTGVSYVGGDAVLANRSWIDITQFEGFEVLDAAPGEPWAANTMLVNGTVLMPAGNPRTQEMLEARGIRTKAVDISELEKAEAGLTCLSIRFNCREGD